MMKGKTKKKKKKKTKVNGAMSREEVRAIVVSKIEVMESIVNDLLANYVKDESDLGGHLQHAGNRLDVIMQGPIDGVAAYKKVRRRW